MRPAWRERAERLRQEVTALYLAARDPRVPWYAKALALLIVAYAFSPIDLIPDFIPVLGYLDDLLLIPLGVLLFVRLIPRDVLEDCRARAREAAARPSAWRSAAVVIATWIVALALAFVIVRRITGAVCPC
jgi:uncharacterized membrane protein YkvA (DUF1232 family)